jgi:hypothetical protein
VSNFVINERCAVVSVHCMHPEMPVVLVRDNSLAKAISTLLPVCNNLWKKSNVIGFYTC